MKAYSVIAIILAVVLFLINFWHTISQFIHRALKKALSARSGSLPYTWLPILCPKIFLRRKLGLSKVKNGSTYLHLLAGV